MLNSVKLLLFVGFVAYLNGEAYSLSCKNQNGKDVDWFVLIKPPKQKSDNPALAAGGGYGFVDSSSKKSGWVLADEDIGSLKSYPGQTFAEVFESPEKYSYIQYNDGKPHGLGHDSSIYAHAKGALVWTDKEAVWLVHSTPKFLPLFDGKKYEFPTSGKTHGQNFLCITIDPKKYVNPILNHIVTIKAQIYGNHISDSLDKKMLKEIQENIDILSKKVRSNKGEPSTGVLKQMDEKRIKELTTEIKSKKGEKFTVVSKSRKDKVDIWSKIVAPAMKVKEFAVKTWVLLQKATSLLDSTCSIRENVKNINDMDLKFTNSPKEVDWGKNDHSKWGVCSKGGDDCYCAGDMNRAESQYKRGGGAVCMHNKLVHDTFQTSYANLFSCDNTLEDNEREIVNEKGIKQKIKGLFNKVFKKEEKN